MNNTQKVIQLPAIIGAPRWRKDGSVSVSFETREMSPEEVLIMLGFKGSEGWLSFSSNKDELPETPEENATIDEKSASERLRNVLYVWYKQEFEAGRFVGLFETFRKEKMEKIIDGVKTKLDK